MRRRREQDLDDEIRSHLQMAARDRIDRGQGPTEAERSALCEFGNVELVKEVTREMWGARSFNTLAQDARYALRTMRRSPGFAAVTILTLGLGIGANTALFSAFEAVLLKMLPVRDPHELFVLEENGPQEPGRALVSWPVFQRLRDAAPAGAGLLATTDTNGFNVATAGDRPRIVNGQLVSGEYFGVLGVRPASGRLLGPEDNRIQDGHPVTVLSYRYWERRYGRNPETVGSAVNVNGTAMTIVGVAEPGFFGLDLGYKPDMWFPLLMQSQLRYTANRASSGFSDSRKPWPPQDDVRWLFVMMRVRNPQSPQIAAGALNVVFRQDLERRLQFEHGERERRVFLTRRLELKPGGQGFALLRDRFRAPLQVLMAMVGLVLLIVCANLANLLLARATARGREIAIRLSIGASRARVLRQLLTESTLLGLAGGALGLLLGSWGAAALPRLLPIGRDTDLHLDTGVLAFTVGLSLLTGILLGLAPALRSTNVDPGLALKAGAAKSGPGRLTTGAGLVVLQVALSALLIAGAGLLGRTFRNLLETDPGFDRDRVLTLQIHPRAAGYKESQLAGLHQQIEERVSALPGVQSAAMALYSIARGTNISRIYVPGYAPAPKENTSIQENRVNPGYFATMGIRLVEGRDFSSRDGDKAPRVAIINEAMARHYFNGASPIGKSFAYDPRNSSGFEIVGVVRDARINNLRELPKPIAYYPLRQENQYANSLEIRTGGDPRALASQIRKAIAEVAPKLQVSDVATLAERINSTAGQERLLAQLAGSFALVALLLACIGLYGLTAYAVVRRTAEIGLRMALGADRWSVIRLIVREAIALVLVGLAIGLGALFPAARLIRALLFGVSPADPITISAAGGLMLAAALLAAYVPARRASHVDPMVALRYE